MARVVSLVSVIALAGCPVGTGATAVSCVPDGSTGMCFEWTGADLPALGAIDATCTQLGAGPVAAGCPRELRTIGCRVERGGLVETRWYRTPGYEVLVECPDAGRVVVLPVEDAGTLDPVSDAGLRCSAPANGASTVFFSNVGPSTVHLRWVTQSCAEVEYAAIPPGGGVNQPTFIGHVWRLRRDAPDGPLLREFLVEAPSASVVVR
ncbi:MAG: hypothetical protein JNJ54_12250 [Myxococcaceae bacterium]|nr:hypothetical protein [Myxococcaceae bacterium]